VREEVTTEITQLRYLGSLENLFICEGAPGDEIVQVHEGRFVDGAFYAASDARAGR
jgi:hypothetical protein